jgi:predicted Zn-dependent protease
VDDIIDRLLISGFSKEQEYEADTRALKILQRAGYNPKALITVLEMLHKEQGQRSGGWFATHPAATDRISQSQRVILEDQISDSSVGLSERNQRFVRNAQTPS